MPQIHNIYTKIIQFENEKNNAKITIQLRTFFKT